MGASGTRGLADTAARSRAFRERAKLEADRYGPDPWVFVRELLQNSRDAGATHVTFTVSEADGHEIVVCRDNGEGMSFDHARRYLFSLYASSKEDSRDQAGKFGVGFWSILRFEPALITVRSRRHQGQGWGIFLDGALENASSIPPLESRGTEVVLRRPGGDGRLEHRVFDAVWQSARYLYLRNDRSKPLHVTINGRPANAEFTLAAPSATFRRGSVRGVVGLGNAPRVELFCRGLRVRAAASLEDLAAASGRHTSRMRVQFPELPGGLAPQALLESDALELMLSRSDARDTRALTRLVRLAQRELERLVDRQLAHARPQPWWRRVAEFFAGHLRQSLVLRTALGSAIGAALAIGLAWSLWGDSGAKSETETIAGTRAELAVGGAPGSAAPRPFEDLGPRYRGPKVDVLAPDSAEPILLHYTPQTQNLYLATLSTAALADDGTPVHDPIARVHGRYIGASCDRSCTRIELPAVLSGPTRIPVPTGFRVVEGSMTLDHRQLAVSVSRHGLPLVVTPSRQEGVLRYAVAKLADPDAPPALRAPSSLPPKLRRFARSLGDRTAEQRKQVLLELVQTLVRYDRSPELAARHTEAIASGLGFIERTLELRAGDCDVQNGLLTALLQESGVPARLAVGYLGVDGGVLPWLHAWVEYRDDDGQWLVADASTAGTYDDFVAAPNPDGGVASAEVADTPSGTDAAPPPSIAAIADPSVTEPPATTRTRNRPSALAWVAQLDASWPFAVRSVPIVLLLAAGLIALGARTRRALKLDEGADLSRLLQGVLQQPGAFSHMSALFNRPLVPLIDGSAISLNRSRELAALGRLYRTRSHPTLAKQAARKGAAVLDDRRPEGRTVSAALGAVDLDHWSRLLGRSRTHALSSAINAALRTRGEDWGIRVASDLAGEFATLDLRRLGITMPDVRAGRLVLISEQSGWMARATELAATNPRVAVFLALDQLAARLDLPGERRARVLAEGAREALMESFPQ